MLKKIKIKENEKCKRRNGAVAMVIMWSWESILHSDSSGGRRFDTGKKNGNGIIEGNV